MMSHMKQPTTNRPTMDYPRTPDGKYKYTTWDGQPLHHKPVITPGMLKSPILPVWLSKHFRRKDTSAAR
jgi:hypothetical protein